MAQLDVESLKKLHSKGNVDALRELLTELNDQMTAPDEISASAFADLVYELRKVKEIWSRRLGDVIIVASKNRRRGDLNGAIAVLLDFTKVCSSRFYRNIAVSQINNYRKGIGHDKTDALRTRAYILSLMGDYQNALHDRQAILQTQGATLTDYYLAADCALSAGGLEEAIVYLNEVLRLGQDLKEPWFDSAARFLLAYTESERGNYESALNNLDHAILLDSGCAMPLPNLGMCDHKRLKKEILHRKEKRK
jgi:tetratricopeptide (TPR) repeat protein